MVRAGFRLVKLINLMNLIDYLYRFMDVEG